ncbi:MAG: hypothetical protein PV340_02735 [Wolbachia sp.]|nr:hypothetical protein [Wolbachia sp.]
MIKHFHIDQIDTLVSFHKYGGINYDVSNYFNKTKLIQDLELLTVTHHLLRIPLLILCEKNDTIIHTELIYTNFSKDIKVMCIMKVITVWAYVNVISYMNRL